MKGLNTRTGQRNVSYTPKVTAQEAKFRRFDIDNPYARDGYQTGYGDRPQLHRGNDPRQQSNSANVYDYLAQDTLANYQQMVQTNVNATKDLGTFNLGNQMTAQQQRDDNAYKQAVATATIAASSRNPTPVTNLQDQRLEREMILLNPDGYRNANRIQSEVAWDAGHDARRYQEWQDSVAHMRERNAAETERAFQASMQARQQAASQYEALKQREAQQRLAKTQASAAVQQAQRQAEAQKEAARQQTIAAGQQARASVYSAMFGAGQSGFRYW